MKQLLLLSRLFITIICQCILLVVDSQRIDCDPCITRSEYTLKVIVHGTVDDAFWQNAQAAITQSSLDMGVQLQMELYDVFDPHQMAADIESIAKNSTKKPPDALLITIPSTVVHEAVQRVVQAGIPVFGFNSGYKVAEELGLLGFFSQNEYLAGMAAGEEFLRIATRNISRAVFVNQQKGLSSLDERFEGFKQSMSLKQVEIVDELVVDLKDPSRMSNDIDSLFNNGCPYDVVLLSGTLTAAETVDSLIRNECQEKVLLGTFDEESIVMTSILRGHIAFATSQQSYLQVSLPVIMASLYATTGKKLTLPRELQTYLTGPAVINKDNFPTDTLVTCQGDAFPVCPNVFAPDGTTISECDCQDRNNIRIGGVLHGVITDDFWDPVFASARQAAQDMGITLELERLQPEDNYKTFYLKMAARIITLCQSGVDGIFVSIPSEVLIEAIEICQLLNIPIISVNSGSGIAEDLGLLQHIGQLEYEAGYGAGQRLIEANMKIGYCFNHEPVNNALRDRCQGFSDAISDASSSETDVRYGGMVPVPENNSSEYKIIAEEAIGVVNGDDWEGIGILLMGSNQINNGALGLKKEHKLLMIGSFDFAEYMYPVIEDGSILFGIDQQPYLQGNLPVYLLTYMAHTKQHLLNKVVQTGPHFVADINQTSEEQQLCEKNFFQVCANIPEENYNFIASYAVIIDYVLVAVTICSSFVALVWVAFFRHCNIVRAGQPQFLVLVVVGCIVSICSIVPMHVETTYRYLKDPSTGEFTTTENPDIRKVDLSCMAGPWLYGIGFVITFAALFAKILRVKVVCEAQARESYRRKTLRFKDIIYIMCWMFAIELTLLLTWQFLSPFRWEREVTQESVDGYALESFGACTSSLGWYFAVGILTFHIICLCYALVLCFQTKHIPTEFAESNYISLAVLCIFQVSILWIPIAAMVKDHTTAFYFVRSCAIFLHTFTVLCLIFIPKMCLVYNGDHLEVSSVRSRESRTALLRFAKIQSTASVWQNLSSRVTWPVISSRRVIGTDSSRRVIIGSDNVMDQTAVTTPVTNPIPFRVVAQSENMAPIPEPSVSESASSVPNLGAFSKS